MKELDEASCVVARHIDGRAVFVDLQPEVREVGRGISTAWFWALEGVPHLPDDVGGQPTRPYFPAPGGLKFGLLRVPAHSDVTVPATPGGGESSGITSNDSATGMHRTTSVDIEFVISGRMVLELADGASRTLSAGDSVVLAGVAHRWYNPFDEPCIYAGVILGANTDDKEAGSGNG